MDKRIVYTRFDGGVSICCPAGEAIGWMTSGGFYLWQEQPRGFAEIQIDRMINRGVRKDAARRYAKAAMQGGLTTAEALGLIRDRDCSHLGTGIELWDISDFPSDFWFFDAWRRSQNGGPVSVSMKLARPIQWKKARSAVEKENKRRAYEFERTPLIEVDWEKFRNRLRSARDELELRQLWPMPR